MKSKSNKQKSMKGDLMPRTLKYELNPSKITNINDCHKNTAVKLSIKNTEKSKPTHERTLLEYNSSISKNTRKSKNEYADHQEKSYENHENNFHMIEAKSHVMSTPKKHSKNEIDSALQQNIREVIHPKLTESPYSAFVKALSPIRDHFSSPNIISLKNMSANQRSLIKYKTPSPINLKDLQEFHQSSPNSHGKKHIMKLDFSCSKLVLKQKYDEINIEQEKNQELRDDFENQLTCNELMNQSPKFNFAINNNANSSVFNPLLPKIDHNLTQNELHLQDANKMGSKSCITEGNILPASESDSQEKSKIQKDFIFTFNTPIINGKNSTKLMLGSMNSFSGKETGLNKLFNSTANKIKVGYTELTDHNSDSSPTEIMRKNNECDSDSETNLKVEKKRVCCNCKKSRCLKLYCDCFAAGEYCQECNCLNCANIESNSTERNQAILNTLDRNPSAFKPKVDKAESSCEEGENEIQDKNRHIKGCNCKKSGCLKKYCECYQANVKCSELCKCDSCKNMDPTTFAKKAQTLTYLAGFNSINGIGSQNILSNHQYTQNEHSLAHNNKQLFPQKLREGYRENIEIQEQQPLVTSKNIGKSKHPHSQKQIDEEYYNIMGANSTKKQKNEDINSPNMIKELVAKNHQQIPPSSSNIKLTKTNMNPNAILVNDSSDRKKYYNKRRETNDNINLTNNSYINSHYAKLAQENHSEPTKKSLKFFNNFLKETCHSLRH